MAFASTLKNLVAPENQKLELLSLVAKNTHNAVIITDANGKIKWVNEGFTHISGYTFEEVKDQKPGSFLQGPDTDPDTVAHIRQKLDELEPFSVEILNYSKQHRPYWLELNVSPVTDSETGVVQHFVAIELDVTERREKEAALKHANHELQEANEELRAAEEEVRQHSEEILQINETLEQQKRELESTRGELELLSLVARKTDNAVIITTPNGQIQWVNEGFRSIAGYSLEDVKGKKPGHVLQGDNTDPKTVQRIRDGLSRGEPVHEEILNYAKDGRPYWLDLRITPVRNEEGEITHFIAIELDTTQRREQEAQLAETNELLTDSIQYARRLQKTTLPALKNLPAPVTNHFLINLPRDIVTGDFYWFQHNGDWLHLVVADCTGHGVPGAMMSMLGGSLMQQIVSAEPNTGPAELLERFNQQLYDHLSEGNNEHALTDGMDLGYIQLNTQTRELRFAGAMRPLLLLREGELAEHKATRRSIGANPELPAESLPPFEEEHLQMQPGDRLYLFSDGFPDQFGENGKKFGKKAVKDLLQSTAGDPCNQQRQALQQALNKHMGNKQRQTDDILMLGLELG